jgi:hypothetical protein
LTAGIENQKELLEVLVKGFPGLIILFYTYYSVYLDLFYEAFERDQILCLVFEIELLAILIAGLLCVCACVRVCCWRLMFDGLNERYFIPIAPKIHYRPREFDIGDGSREKSFTDIWLRDGSREPLGLLQFLNSNFFFALVTGWVRMQRLFCCTRRHVEYPCNLQCEMPGERIQATKPKLEADSQYLPYHQRACSIPYFGTRVYALLSLNPANLL